MKPKTKTKPRRTTTRAAWIQIRRAFQKLADGKTRPPLAHRGLCYAILFFGGISFKQKDEMFSQVYRHRPRGAHKSEYYWTLDRAGAHARIKVIDAILRRRA